MPARFDDRTTRRPQRAATTGQRRPVLTLTVLWHWDSTRVGEIATIAGGASVSRIEPEFAPIGRVTGGRAPLGDVHLSRRPALAIDVTREAVSVRALSEGACTVDGALLGAAPVRLEPSQVDHGVGLELGDRVALLLHRRLPPVASNDHGLIGASDAIDRVRTMIDMAAPSASPVLILGETGTGKELVARALHRAGLRRDCPFVAVNLAALTTGTATAALFGHRRGAYTGATESSRGYFREAAGGTLFLDEVGAASLEVQAMLLRALEQYEIQPVGAPVPEPIDVRVIAATDADLTAAVREGTFRDALLHRIGALTIGLPPLRARRDDIARLTAAFLAEELAAVGASAALRRGVDDPLWLPAGLVAAACRGRWDGNVRELRNMCRRLAALHAEDDRVRLAVAREFASPPPPASSSALRPTSPPAPPTDDARIVATLAEHDWQIGRAAAVLGISRNTVYAAMARSGAATKARELDPARIRAVVAASGGDLQLAAKQLRVSLRALKLRMRELGP